MGNTGYRYLENVPAIVPLLEKEYRNAAARLAATQEELNDLHPDKYASHICPSYHALHAVPHAFTPCMQLNAEVIASIRTPHMQKNVSVAVMHLFTERSARYCLLRLQLDTMHTKPCSALMAAHGAAPGFALSPWLHACCVWHTSSAMTAGML